VANSAASFANGAFGVANTGSSFANGAFVTANASFIQANNISSYANAQIAILTGIENSQNANITSAQAFANGAYTVANTFTSFQSSGGVISGPVGITGNLGVTGNLAINGTVTYMNVATFQTVDSLIELASNNTTDTVDIGIYGQYVSSGTNYTGLARKAAGNYYLFQGVQSNPTGNNIGTIAPSNYATLNANIAAGSITASQAIGIASGGTNNTGFTNGTITYYNGTSIASLANPSVTPGTYGGALAIPQVTVDGYGRVTGVQTVSAPTGPQGYTGSPGPQGSPGSPGSTGAQGSPGSPGSTGVQGSPGSPGSTGAQGSPGSPGAQGPQGYTGSPGAGAQGPQGYTGSPGAGAQGPQGYTGSPGSPGPQGYTGSPGSPGPQGYTGVQGAQGSTGSPGAQGPQGGFSTGSNAQVNSLGVGTAADGTSGDIVATGNITAYYSDERLKNKLGNIVNALEKVLSLNGFYYEPNDIAQAMGYPLRTEVGVSAQEVQAVMPEVVVPAPIDNNYLTVHYEKIIPLIIEAIKELKSEVDSLKGK
jgi:hypothetical protein